MIKRIHFKLKNVIDSSQTGDFIIKNKINLINLEQ